MNYENPNAAKQMPLLDQKMEALQKEYGRLSESVSMLENIGNKIKTRLNGDAKTSMSGPPDSPATSDTFSKIDMLTNDFRVKILQLEETINHFRQIFGTT